MLSAGTIINGGFRLVRERPVSVLTWGLVYIVTIFAGLFAVLLPLVRAQMAAMSAGLTPGTPPGTLPPGFDPFAMIGQIYLFDFVVLALIVVLLAAGMRAVLRPEARAFAYLRLGMDELRLLGLFVLGVLCLMALGIVLGLVVGIAAVAMGGATSADASPGLPFALVPMILAIFAVTVFVQVRLSPSLPLTMIRGRITVTEAWRLTRGRFWTLFGGYFVLWLILMAAYLAIVSIVAYPILHALTAMPGLAGGGARPDAMAIAAQLGGAGFGLIGIVGCLAFLALAGVAIAFASGGIATATAALLEEQRQMAEVM